MLNNEFHNSSLQVVMQQAPSINKCTCLIEHRMIWEQRVRLKSYLQSIIIMHLINYIHFINENFIREIATFIVDANEWFDHYKVTYKYSKIKLVVKTYMCFTFIEHNTVLLLLVHK